MISDSSEDITLDYSENVQETTTENNAVQSNPVSLVTNNNINQYVDNEMETNEVEDNLKNDSNNLSKRFCPTTIHKSEDIKQKTVLKYPSIKCMKKPMFLIPIEKNGVIQKPTIIEMKNLEMLLADNLDPEIAEASNKRIKLFDELNDDNDLVFSPQEKEWEEKLTSTSEERLIKEKELLNSVDIPKKDSPLDKKELRIAGDYILGPSLGSFPVHSIVHCLARKKGTTKFYTLKILTIKDYQHETEDDRQGKMLLHNEYSLLSLLSGQKGIIQHHGLFQDYAVEANRRSSDGSLLSTGRIVRRLYLVLDCVTRHYYKSETADYVNLQIYVIEKKKLEETDALVIFYNIVKVVKSLHDQNIVHRDLKLGNFVLRKTNHKVIVTNFCLGHHLVYEDEKLQDQRGSPAYISPDVLSSKPYLGKPSDMWALGVVLFTMLYGIFPFYDERPNKLFHKIKEAKYQIPKDNRVREDTQMIIKGLLVLDTEMRLTASEVLEKVSDIINKRQLQTTTEDQIVPDINNDERTPEAVFKDQMQLPGRSNKGNDSRLSIDSLFPQPSTKRPLRLMNTNSRSYRSRPKPPRSISCVPGETRHMTATEYKTLSRFWRQSTSAGKTNASPMHPQSLFQGRSLFVFRNLPSSSNPRVPISGNSSRNDQSINNARPTPSYREPNTTPRPLSAIRDSNTSQSSPRVLPSYRESSTGSNSSRNNTRIAIPLNSSLTETGGSSSSVLETRERQTLESSDQSSSNSAVDQQTSDSTIQRTSNSTNQPLS